MAAFHTIQLFFLFIFFQGITIFFYFSQLTLGRLLAADDSALCLSDQLPLGLGQAHGTQGEQHKALHDGECGECGAQSV